MCNFAPNVRPRDQASPLRLNRFDDCLPLQASARTLHVSRKVYFESTCKAPHALQLSYGCLWSSSTLCLSISSISARRVLAHLTHRFSPHECISVHRKLLSPANVDLLMGSGVVDALVLGHNNSAMSAASLESIAASGPALKGTPCRFYSLPSVLRTFILAEGGVLLNLCRIGAAEHGQAH